MVWRGNPEPRLPELCPHARPRPHLLLSSGRQDPPPPSSGDQLLILSVFAVPLMSLCKQHGINSSQGLELL